MKAAALVVECNDGKIHSVAGTSLVALREIARAVRDSKVIEIGKKSVGVKCGTLLASWRSSPDLRFRC